MGTRTFKEESSKKEKGGLNEPYGVGPRMVALEECLVSNILYITTGVETGNRRGDDTHRPSSQLSSGLEAVVPWQPRAHPAPRAWFL